MDHIRQRDWDIRCPSRGNRNQFVEEHDIENCVVEKIIRNRFWDPLISSDEEEPVGPIDWDLIFNRKSNKQQYRHFVPGYRKAPPYPKLSSLTQAEHLKGIKVLCAQNKHILPKEFLSRPVKNDYRVFEEKKPVYEQEQQEFLEWAKQLWQTTNCIRALRPAPLAELVYDAEFKMKAHRIQCMPKAYTLAAQIPLRADNQTCEMIMPKTDLIKVDISKLAKVCYPQIYEVQECILRKCPLPKPCNKHPTGFKLPNESEPSMLPLTELNKELAQFALDNSAEYVASESAIKCLLETDRCWTLPLSVCEVIGPDGDRINIVVLGNEFPEKREPATMRSYKAFKHLLLNAFMGNESQNKNPPAQSSSINMEKKPRTNRNTTSSHRAAMAFNSAVRKVANYDDSDSDSENRLQIDLGDDAATDNNASGIEDNQTDPSVNDTSENNPNNTEIQPRKILKARPRTSLNSNQSKNNQEIQQMDSQEGDSDRELVIDMDSTELDNNSDKHSVNDSVMDSVEDKLNSDNQILSELAQESRKTNSQEENNEIDMGTLLECNCKDTKFEFPAPRSYKKVQIRNHSNRDQLNVIIHSSHTLRKDTSSGEVILEPILEYQSDIGATKQSPEKILSHAFSLMLRKNAELTLVRVDGTNGELISMEYLDLRELTERHAHCSAGAVANTVYTTLCQLAGLLAGHYLLRHEPSHGLNALLFGRAAAGAALAVPLQSAEALSPAEEARLVSAAPRLDDTLLPIHKFRRQLPLTFTYNHKLVAKENPNKVVHNKPKLPPAALQWPKKKGRKKRKAKKT